MITVFTPAYNRANLMPIAYKSLCKQTCKNFEWLIVDDGSTDNTEEVVNGFIQEGKTPIRYVKKTNGGKHTAINRGLKEAKGELFLILDSDDSLPFDAVENILFEYEKVRGKSDLAGVCGLMAHHDGTLIGSGFPKDGMYVSSIDLRHQSGVTGDLMEVWKTDVIREYPFPVVDGERFCPEVLVWNRIALKYKLYCFNKVVYYRDYLDGGLTDNIVRIRMKSPIASMMCYAEMNKLPIPFVQKVKAAINYWRFRFCIKEGVCPTISPIWALLAPLAYIMHLRDLKCLK